MFMRNPIVKWILINVQIFMTPLLILNVQKMGWNMKIGIPSISPLKSFSLNPLNLLSVYGEKEA